MEVMIHRIFWSNQTQSRNTFNYLLNRFFSHAYEHVGDCVGWRQQIESVSKLPFGITGDESNIYFTDWTLKSIIHFKGANFGSDSKKLPLPFIGRPTGIVAGNTKYQPFPGDDPCANGAHVCSDICVPRKNSFTSVHYKCSCPENTGYVIDETGLNCIFPKEFVLFADFNRIMLQTLDTYGDKKRPKPRDSRTSVGPSESMEFILTSSFEPFVDPCQSQ